MAEQSDANDLLYLQCESGISGDMVVGSLLDLGASEKHLREALASLPLEGYEVRITRKQAGGVDACDFDVVLDAEHENHDHDMAYLYGDLDGGDVGHGHEHHHHDHDHHHDHHDGHHHHVHRRLADVLAIIDAGDLAPHAAETARRIFQVLAEGEAKAHGTTPEEVLFHEVGAVDSIVDIVSVAVCLDDLGISRVAISPLAEGHGRVRTQHGVLAVPVPAVAAIAARYELPFSHLEHEGEFVTPTGAAVAAALRTDGALPASYLIKGVGTGSGKRAYEPVSTVRAFLLADAAQQAPGAAGHVDDAGEKDEGPVAPSSDAGALVQLETEVDDCTGEALGHALEKLFELGVREAHYLPVYMKKNRPAWQLQVLCDKDQVLAAEKLIFEETTTIGIRRFPVERTALPRAEETVRTPLGTADVKTVTLPDGRRRSYPEYESVRRLAEAAGVAFQEAYRAVLAACENASS